MILVTRQRQFAAQSSLALKNLGYEAAILPMLHMRYLYKNLVDEAYNSILFTSKNAVIGTAHLSWLKHKRVYAIGLKTAKVLRDLHFKHVLCCHEEQNNSANLAEFVAKNEKLPAKLLYVSGAHVAGNLQSLLQERGYEVAREIVYESLMTTTLSKQAIDSINSAATIVLLYSPRAALAFSTLINKYCLETKNKVAICISQNCAAVLDAKSWMAVHVSQNTDENSMFALLQKI